MSIIAATFMTLLASVVTWLCTSARWRRGQDDLLAKIATLQDDASRARVHTVQVTQATAEWSAGYKQGCSDMIKAMAALHGGSAQSRQADEDVTSAK